MRGIMKCGTYSSINSIVSGLLASPLNVFALLLDVILLSCSYGTE